MRFDRICPCNRRRKNMSWNQSLESKPAMWAMRCVRKGSKSPSQRGLSLPEAASDGGRGVCVALLEGSRDARTRTSEQTFRLATYCRKYRQKFVSGSRDPLAALVNVRCALVAWRVRVACSSVSRS